MTALIAQYGVFVVALIIYTGEIGIPTLVPGEIAILIAGSQAVHSVPQLIGVWLLFGVIDVMGCSSIHLASRTSGNRLLLHLLRRVQPHHECHEAIVEKWRSRLGGRDSAVVFVTRLIPIFRLYASITTGLIRIRFRDFVIGAVPASLLWAATPLTVGYLLRSKIRSLEGQYPQMIHYVIIGSVVSTALLAVTWWVRRGGSRAAAIRRVRLIFGLGAVGGALARLSLMALYGDQSLSHRYLLPSMSDMAAWVTVFSCVALGLLWIAARDLHVIRTRPHQRHHRVGAHGIAAWVGLMAMFCLLNTLAGGHSPALGLI